MPLFLKLKYTISSIGITKTTIVLKQVSKALPTCHWFDKLITPPLGETINVDTLAMIGTFKK